MHLSADTSDRSDPDPSGLVGTPVKADSADCSHREKEFHNG
jgi:hypothetical protein